MRIPAFKGNEMPNFGWKCFIGSFLFSLAAVFASTKVYLLLPIEHQNPVEKTAFEDIETKNIDLFADNEESNPIVEKFNEINNKQAKIAAIQDIAPTTDTQKSVQSDVSVADKEDKPIEISSLSSDVLYAPDEDMSEISVTDADNSANKDIDEAPEISENQETNPVNSNSFEQAILVDDTEDESLQIADASEAKPFTIPLLHNFQVAAQKVEVSNEAANSQVALASNNVLIQNIGTENKIAAASGEPNNLVPDTAENDSDPWEVAAVGNSHITKNKIDSFTSDGNKTMEALDQDKLAEAKSPNEKQVAYKMVKNILIPIPEDIANDENLTPQLSYSEENKKLSEKLQKEGILDPPTPIKEEIKNKEETTTTPVPLTSNQSENKLSEPSLTDSIAAWFSSNPSSDNNSTNNKADKDKDKDKNKNKKEESSSSTFSKLLGLGAKKDNNIAPSELKLAFQPNRAEISGQTLDWLKAFSLNAVNNENVFVEIRIDGSSSFELQQKRLNLLYSILVNNGVDYNKINIIFTDREPNSFIIRNVRYASEDDAINVHKKAYNPWY